MPVPANPLTVPPTTETSPIAKSAEASLSVAVIVAVCPVSTANLLLVRAIVGTT